MISIMSKVTTSNRRGSYQKGSTLPFQPRKMPRDYNPSPTTVIFGRAKPGCNPYSGNKRLHKIVSLYVNDYSKAQTRGDKIAIVTSIIEKMNEITSCNDKTGYPSFVVKKDDGFWYEAEPHKVRDKIGGILRESLHTKYKSSTKAKRRAERAMKVQMKNQETMTRLQQRMNRQKTRSCYLSKWKEELIQDSTSPSPTTSSSSNDDNPMSSFTTKQPKNQPDFVPSSSSLSVIHQKNLYWGQHQMNVFMPLDFTTSHTTSTTTTTESSCVSLPDQVETFQQDGLLLVGATTMNDGKDILQLPDDGILADALFEDINDDDHDQEDFGDLETVLSPRIFDGDDMIGLEPLPYF